MYQKRIFKLFKVAPLQDCSSVYLKKVSGLDITTLFEGKNKKELEVNMLPNVNCFTVKVHDGLGEYLTYFVLSGW